MRKNFNPENALYNLRKMREWHARRAKIDAPKRRIYKDTGTERECSVCCALKPLTEFNKYLPQGILRRQCKVCERRTANQRAQGKRTEFRKTHPKISRYTKLYSDTDKERQCSVCMQLKPASAFNNYRSGKPRRQCADCQWKRGDQLRRLNPAWNTIKRSYDANAKAKRRAAIGVSRLLKTDIEKLWTEQGGHCAYCQVILVNGYHVEHKIPLTRGGVHAAENICLSCPTCNHRKHRLTEEEFRFKMGA